MRFRDLLIRNIASPYGMIATSSIVFLVAFVFPPTIYTNHLHEPDFVFLHLASFVFFFLCTMAFIFGLMVVNFFYPVQGFSYGKKECRFSPAWFILLPVILGSAAVVLSMVLLLRNNNFLLQLLLTAEGEQIHSGGIETEGTMVHAAPVLLGIVLWAIWRKDQLNIRGRMAKFMVRSGIIFATVAVLLSSTLKLARSGSMPILVGVAVLFLLRRFIKGTLTPASVLKFAALFVAIIVGFFAAFSILRGLYDPSALIDNILGYTIASYNRMAAILDGRLRYPFAGRGIYLSTFVSFNNTFIKLFHINPWPDVYTVWYSEFGAVDASGLDGELIWSGAFGYIFSDLKWLSPILLFIYGMITGSAWRALKLGKMAGIVFYPWCAFCILFWFGGNFLFDTQAVVLLFVVIVLSIYELLFILPPVKSTQMRIQRMQS